MNHIPRSAPVNPLRQGYLKCRICIAFILLPVALGVHGLLAADNPVTVREGNQPQPVGWPGSLGVVSSNLWVGKTLSNSPIFLVCSTNVTTTASSSNGAVVFFTSTASGGCSPPPSLSCAPPSGS